jgi:hypothetical protein
MANNSYSCPNHCPSRPNLTFMISSQVAMRALGFPVKKEEVKKIVSEYDKAGTGRVGAEDFMEISEYNHSRFPGLGEDHGTYTDMTSWWHESSQGPTCKPLRGTRPSSPPPPPTIPSHPRSPHPPIPSLPLLARNCCSDGAVLGSGSRGRDSESLPVV